MKRVGAAWNRFWFGETSMLPLAIFRIGFGCVVLAWAVSLTLDVDDLFGPDGVLPRQPEQDGAWGLLGWIDTSWAPRVLLGLLALAALALILGRRPRVAAAVIFVCLVSLGHRNPFAGNAGDGLLRTLSFFLVLAPSAALSLEGRRLPAWPLRLIQVQLSVLYVSTVWAKARGEHWNDGTAIAFAWRTEDYGRLPVPDVGRWLELTNVITFGVLGLELALGILVWNRVLRPYVLFAGVALHLGIEYALRVGFFTWTILAAYLVWLSPAAAERVVAAVRGRLERRGYAPGRGPQEA